MQTIATYITYNDIETIAESIESIQNKVDKIIVVDGRFKDFPGDKDYSSGDSLKYLLELDKKDGFEIIFAGGLTEVEKRNIYLRHIKDGYTVLNLDADEILVGSIPKLECDIGLIQVGEQGDRRRHGRANRFFVYHDGLHYWGRHSLIMDKDNELFAYLQYAGKKYTTQKITEFELLHRNDLRSDGRKKDKKKYYEILMAREAKIDVPAN